MDAPSELTLVGDNGACGALKINLIPTDETGQKNIEDSMDDDGEYIEDPMELLDRRLDFRVLVESAILPESFCKDTFVEYSIMG